MVAEFNNYFRLIAYLLIAVSCFFSLRHHACSRWLIVGSLFWSVIAGSLLLSNLWLNKPYIVQFLHTANVFTLAIFFWIHFLNITPTHKWKQPSNGLKKR